MTYIAIVGGLILLVNMGPGKYLDVFPYYPNGSRLFRRFLGGREEEDLLNVFRIGTVACHSGGQGRWTHHASMGTEGRTKVRRGSWFLLYLSGVKVPWRGPRLGYFNLVFPGLERIVASDVSRRLHVHKPSGKWREMYIQSASCCRGKHAGELRTLRKGNACKQDATSCV